MNVCFIFKIVCIFASILGILANLHMILLYATSSVMFKSLSHRHKEEYHPLDYFNQYHNISIIVIIIIIFSFVQFYLDMVMSYRSLLILSACASKDETVRKRAKEMGQKEKSLPRLKDELNCGIEAMILLLVAI